MILMPMKPARSASVLIFCFGSLSYYRYGQIIFLGGTRKRNLKAVWHTNLIAVLASYPAD
jgi:hypothetical protein